jgi:hypothetical protein
VDSFSLGLVEELHIGVAKEVVVQEVVVQELPQRQLK